MHFGWEKVMEREKEKDAEENFGKKDASFFIMHRTKDIACDHRLYISQSNLAKK